MRTNQLSMTLTRFNDQVPKGYPKSKQVIHVYADSSNSAYEALSKGYAELVNLLLEYEKSFGRCDGHTNADGTFYSRMLGSKMQVSEYYDDSLIEDMNDIIFYIENAVGIITIITESNNLDDAREALMKKYELPAHKANKIMKLRFAMFTKEDLNEYKIRRDEYIKIINKNKEEGKK